MKKNVALTIALCALVIGVGLLVAQVMREEVSPSVSEKSASAKKTDPVDGPGQGEASSSVAEAEKRTPGDAETRPSEATATRKEETNGNEPAGGERIKARWLAPLHYSQAAIPSDLTGYHRRDERERANAVRDIARRGNLTQEEIDFFRASLADPRLERLERHLMAEALHALDEKIANLHETFMASIEDEAESTGWRLYAVQHLALTMEYSDDPIEVERALRNLSNGANSEFATQAMMMMDVLERSGPLTERKDFSTSTRNLSAVPSRLVSSTLTIVQRNSSPPYRKIVSKGRKLLDTVCATIFNTASPVSCPHVSLNRLK